MGKGQARETGRGWFRVCALTGGDGLRLELEGRALRPGMTRVSDL